MIIVVTKINEELNKESSACRVVLTMKEKEMSRLHNLDDKINVRKFKTDL